MSDPQGELPGLPQLVAQDMRGTWSRLASPKLQRAHWVCMAVDVRVVEELMV